RCLHGWCACRIAACCRLLRACYKVRPDKGRQTPDRRSGETSVAMSATAIQGGLFSLTGRQWLILLMVQLSNMLFGMTITLANLVLPQVRGTLSATQDEISW